MRGSDKQGFLQPGVFRTRVLTLGLLITRGLTTRECNKQGSYNQGFLEEGVLQPGFVRLSLL